MVQTIKYSKCPRLKLFDYSGPYCYFITICTYSKVEYFKGKIIVGNILEELMHCATAYDFSIIAYCFMPDHLHLLVAGKDNSSLKKFIKIFKQKTAYNFKTKNSNILWQRSYYDHVVRKEESVEDIARYILENPVRKGLVEDYRDYPFSGSLVFDKAKL
jgi:putative transposase